MRRIKTWVLFSISLIVATGISYAQKKQKPKTDVQLFTENVFHLSEVMLHDVANPPAASRFYSYSMLGAYETLLFGKGGVPDINQQLQTNPNIVAPEAPKAFNVTFSCIYAMLDVGRQIMPSGPMLKKNQEDLKAYFLKKKILSSASMDSQIKFAEAIAAKVMVYARADNYNKLSTYPRYTPSKKEGHWFPTPPEYMSAIEPRWKTVRPFFLDSGNQFIPPPPTPFSKDSTSEFIRLTREVYTTGNNATEEQRKIAAFWDCNPFAVTYSGHMAIGLKKISPGGHWMGITGIACAKAGVSTDSAVLIHTVVAMALHDSFINCWVEKYNSDRIRPETAINKYLDGTWRPILQTPPFPEYTSGHSVASAAASSVLTGLLGDNFSFTDNSEVYFGLPDRHFTSFYHAANEAAISRFYGGIHFRDACDAGLKHGHQVGEWVVEKLRKARR